MNAPASSLAPAEKLLSSVEAEISKFIEQKNPNQPAQIESDAERIRAAIARLTSNSIDGLEGLMSEVQQLQIFLKSEVERVQCEIESALAGIKIIIETIAPWEGMSVPAAPARTFRAGPAANIEAVQPRR
jgi:predicted transcriptional regulator